MADVVQGLEREAGHQRRVADDHGDPLAGALDVARGREPFGDRQARARVAAVEHVVLAFRAAREAADAIDLAERAEPVHAAREELVRVGLVPGVPDDPICRRVQQAVQGDRDLDDAEARAEVATGLGDGRDDRVADLPRECLELLLRQAAQVRGTGESGEDGSGHGAVRDSWLGLARRFADREM